MGYKKIEVKPKDSLPASLINAIQDAIIENENAQKQVVPISRGGTGATNAASAISNLGGARIEVGSYVGTGKNGINNPNVLSFAFIPKLVIVSNGQHFCVFINGLTESLIINITGYSSNTVAWDGNTLQWYNTGNMGYFGQMNGNGTTYYYVAIG